MGQVEQSIIKSGLKFGKKHKKSLTLQETIDILKVLTQRDFVHPIGLGIRQAIQYLQALKVIKRWTDIERR